MKNRKVIVLAVTDSEGGHYNNDEIEQGARALKFKYQDRLVGRDEGAYTQDVQISTLVMDYDDTIQGRDNEPGERRLGMTDEAKQKLRDFCAGANDCGIYIVAHGNSRGYVGSMGGSVTGTMLGSFVKTLGLPRISYICVLSCHAAAISAGGAQKSIVVDICDTFSDVVNGPPQIAGYGVGVFLHGEKTEDETQIGRKYVGIGPRGGRSKDTKIVRTYEPPADIEGLGKKKRETHDDIMAAQKTFKKVYTYDGGNWVNTFMPKTKRIAN